MVRALAHGRWISAGCLAVALLALTAAALRADLAPETPDIGGPTSLAGQLLVATPAMRPPFDHAVVLLARHSRSGAFGVIVNRPLATRPIALMLRTLGADAAGVTGDIRIFYGGPVGTGTAFVVHSTDYRRDGTVDIDSHVALSDAAGALRDIGLGHGPAKGLVALGYAGWGPRQLDDEIARGAWVTVPESTKLVFDDDRTKVWSEAMALYNSAR